MWSTTFGHQQQIEKLKKAINTAHLAHAYLFSGIPGIGKKRVAIGFAQGLICESTNKPCESCSPCLKVAKQTHADFIVVSPEGKTIRVEALRDLKHSVYLHPLEAHVRVVIIDEAEKMTESGANALLKILEEPPANNFFILISERPHRLLSTIRSRCHHLPFHPLKREEIKQILAQSELSADEIEMISALGHGSLETAKGISKELFETARTHFKRIHSNMNAVEILGLAENLGHEEELPTILKLWQHFYYQQLPQTEQPHAVISSWEAVQNALRGLDSYANKQLLVESLLFKIASTRPQ